MRVPPSWFALPAFACSLAAQQPVASRLTEAALFKNGMAFLTRTVAIPGPGTWQLTDLPLPVHGTFWILPKEGEVAVKEARALNAPITVRRQETRLAALLMLNAGRPLELKTGEGWIQGEILRVPEDPAPRATRLGRHEEEESSAFPPSNSPETLRIKTAQGLLVVPTSSIHSFRVPGGDLLTEQTAPQTHPTLQFTTTGGRGRLAVLSLTRGLTWAPSYLVDLSDPKQAVVRGKAALVNDLEPLAGTTVQLIAGYPNLAFGHVRDALVPTQTLQSFLEALGITTREGRSSVMSQVMMNAAPIEMTALPALSTEDSDTRDLFFQKLEGVSLAKGERSEHALFESRVPYEHVYVWDVTGLQEDLDRHDRERSRAREEVWHQVRLKHGGSAPWSSGPAMTIQQGRILGQDTLAFTPLAGETLLRITKALDVVAEKRESELRREPTPNVRASGTWDLVTVQGELHLTNRRATPSRVVIRRQLSGELAQASLKPALHALPEGLLQPNRKLQLTWETTVPARESLKISYTYKVVIQR